MLIPDFVIPTPAGIQFPTKRGGWISTSLVPSERNTSLILKSVRPEGHHEVHEEREERLGLFFHAHEYGTQEPSIRLQLLAPIEKADIPTRGLIDFSSNENDAIRNFSVHLRALRALRGAPRSESWAPLISLKTSSGDWGRAPRSPLVNATPTSSSNHYGRRGTTKRAKSEFNPYPITRALI